ncbi:MAG: hypothetical protein ABI539_02970 [Acidobacteriota bacterium]
MLKIFARGIEYVNVLRGVREPTLYSGANLDDKLTVQRRGCELAAVGDGAVEVVCGSDITFSACIS